MHRRLFLAISGLFAAASIAALPTATPVPSAFPSETAKATPATPLPSGDSASPAESAAAGTPSPAKFTFSQCHVEGPYIAMTFDDGPSGPNTPRLLEMLKQRKIHATFFLIGQNAAEYPEIVKRIVAEGHEVGNHSWSHPQLSAMSDAAVRDQLQKTNDAIEQATGAAPKVMRPPYGAFTARQRAWAHGTWGFKIILWDVDPLDWKIRNSAHVKAEILKQTVPGSIILSHDIHKTTVDAMPETLDALLAKGFKFVTVSELIAMDRPVKPKPKIAPASPASPVPAREFIEAGKTPVAPSTPPPAAKP